MGGGFSPTGGGGLHQPPPPFRSGYRYLISPRTSWVIWSVVVMVLEFAE
jgi:hypothetical protein